MESTLAVYKNIRVRTGCLTCRKRHVKCDEAKPRCARCVKANVVCDGYERKRSTSRPKAMALALAPGSHVTDASQSSATIKQTVSPVPSLPESISLCRGNGFRQQLAFYHHFVTDTVTRLFDPDFIYFWRDEVASIAWEHEVILEAILSLGAIHQAHQLSVSNPTSSFRLQSHLFGLSSYGKALKLMPSHVAEIDHLNLEVVVIAMVLFAYCECVMNRPKSALRHLRACVQLLEPGRVPVEPSRNIAFVALRATVTRLDFLAQSIIPFAQPSILKPSASGYMSFSPASETDRPTLLGERMALSDIISRYNDIGNIVWGPWSSNSSRPSVETLSNFQMELLRWRTNSPLTFASCGDYSDPTTTLTSSQTVSELVIPPKPLSFQSGLAAVNVALFNNYMACSYCMLSNGVDFDRNALYAFDFVYQNMRIAESGITENAVHSITEEPLDISISLLLYLGFRRCYCESWQKWTIHKLRQCGRQGILDGHAFANTLENLYLLQTRAALQNTNSPLGVGPLSRRILPLLMPKDDDDRLVAYYFTQATPSTKQSDIVLRVVGRASWKQDDLGNMTDVKFDLLEGATVMDVSTLVQQHYDSWSQPAVWTIR